MSTALRVCHVWDSDYPWDVRMEKVSSALTGAGIDVAIVARNRRREVLKESLPEGTVYRMPPWQWLGQKIDSAAMFPAFFSPRWYRLIDRVVTTQSSDVVLVRDLPLAPTAIAVAKKHGLPVIMDMAENYPAMLQELRDTGVATAMDFFVRNPNAASAIERWVLPRLDHLITVVRESSDRVGAMDLKRTPPMTVVSNTPPISRVAAESAEDRNSNSTTTRIVYLGLIEEPRGLRSVLESMKILLDRGKDIVLDVVGDGRELPVFRQLAADLSLQDNRVIFHGRQPHSRALEFVASAHIGLIPHLSTGNWVSTIPNKLFDYMAAGLTVVASDVPPVRRVLDETGAGVLHAPGDAQHLATAISRSLDPAFRKSSGLNGMRAVREKYHWEAEIPDLIRALRPKS